MTRIARDHNGNYNLPTDPREWLFVVLENEEQPGDLYAYFTPTAYWKDVGEQIDAEVARAVDPLVPEYLARREESDATYYLQAGDGPEGRTVESVRKDLLACGFKEDDGFTALVNTPRFYDWS